ncbi:MAG: Ig-like domain-containing protein [Bacteroidota bacterium]
MKILKFILFISLISLTSAQPPNNFTGLKLCIDPGHGGNNAANDRRVEPDPGNVFWESESNFQKALWLRPMLQSRGATVFLTRETNNYPTDDDPTLTERWQFANANNVHWFHSIHSNATGGTNTSTNYTLVLLKENISTRQPAFPAAVEMSYKMYTNLRAKNRTGASGGNISGYPGVYKDYTFYGGTNGGFNLGVLSGLVMPGQLSEGSFHDFYPETRRLLNNHYRKGEAYALYNGFVEYYNIPYDTLGIVCGTQKNGTVPINNIVVRLLPLNKVYNGDTFNNGYFMFDSLPSGNYSIVYETPGYAQDTVNFTMSAVGRIVEMLPNNGAKTIPRDTVLTFNFLEPIDTALVRSSFSIVPALPGVISWNPGNTVMTYTPSVPLAYKTTYTVTLANMGNTPQPTVFVDNKTVTSNVGSKNFVSTFETISMPPHVILTQPVANDTSFKVSLTLGIRFSETMDTTSVRTAFQITPATVGTFVWTSSGATNNTLLWKPVSGAFEYETHYTVTIGAGAKSIYGFSIDGNKDTIPGDPYTLQFRTERMPTGVDDNQVPPLTYSLGQNYPNPFNPQTVIDFSVASAGFVTLKVYDVVGREIASLIQSELSPGKYQVVWDAAQYSSGMYFYRISTDNFTSIKRMMLVK